MKKFKKLLLLFLFFCSCNHSKAQLNTGIGIGYDTYGRAVSSWSVGATVAKLLEIQGEVRPSLSRSVFGHNYIGGRIGINMVNPDSDNIGIILGGGYFYDLRSEDKTKLNKYYWATFIKTIVMVNDNGGVFAEALYLNKSVQISAGIHFKFTKQSHPYN